MPEITLLKLGGSLITDKNTPHTIRPAALARLCEEIARARRSQPDMALILGHGSGSFGHVVAKKYATRQGVRTPEQWQGFAEVWLAAAELNRLVLKALHAAGLPAISFPPSAAVIARQGKVVRWDLTALQTALQVGLLPVIQGDTILDETLGGTILSTEDLFEHLAGELKPQRILLAGIEAGVWEDYPACTRLIPEITPANLDQIAPSLGGSSWTDVTGGMASKVQQSLAFTEKSPGAEVFIFSGEIPGAVEKALAGSLSGTRIHEAP